MTKPETTTNGMASIPAQAGRRAVGPVRKAEGEREPGREAGREETGVPGGGVPSEAPGKDLETRTGQAHPVAPRLRPLCDQRVCLTIPRTAPGP